MRNIYLRSNIFYYRKTIPKRLKIFFQNKTLYIRTLGTKSKVLALKYAKLLNQKFNAIKEVYFMNLDISLVNQLVQEFHNTLLEITEMDLRNTPNPEDTFFALTLEDNIKHLQNNFQAQKYEDKEIKVIVDKLNFTPNEEQKKEIGKILLDSKINHLKNIYQKIEKEEYKKAKIQTIINTTNVNLQQAQNEDKPKQEIKKESIKTIQNTKEKYFKYQDSIDTWSKSTLQINIRALKWLERYFEDKDISTINYDDLIEFRTSLLCIPDNVQKFFDVNATFAEIIEGTEEQDLKTLSNNTINKTILRVNQYLTYMCKIKYMDGNDLTIPKYPDDSKEREAYTYEEIQKIKEVVEDIEEDKFITNIAIYQGMRLKEITQLTKNDIIQNNGMYCIDINRNNEKTTKTRKSVRLIPIHDKLLEVGFLNFVQSKQDGENLFSIDNLKFTKYYGKKYKDLINEEKTFYSLRHSFVNELIQNNQKTEHIQAFVGHSQDAKITFGYSDPINTKLLKELLEFIDY